MNKLYFWIILQRLVSHTLNINKSILLAKEEAEEEIGEDIAKWWDNDNPTDNADEAQGYEMEQKESDETLERRRLLTMIAAQEKAR